MIELKSFVKFVIEFGEAIEKAGADKKINAMDLPLLIGPLMQLGPAFENFGAVKEQAKLLVDPAKMAEIIAFVKEELDLDNDKIEFMIEEGLQLGMAIYAYVTLFKKAE